jgi:hypothetical protein
VQRLPRGISEEGVRAGSVGSANYFARKHAAAQAGVGGIGLNSVCCLVRSAKLDFLLD